MIFFFLLLLPFLDDLLQFFLRVKYKGVDGEKKHHMETYLLRLKSLLKESHD